MRIKAHVVSPLDPVYTPALAHSAHPDPPEGGGKGSESDGGGKGLPGLAWF